MESGNPITYFGKTDARGKHIPFGIREDDRSRHMYVIGKTGMGKSTLLENLAVQDIQSGNGLTFIDPHGQTAETLLNYIPEDRVNDVLYFAPFDMGYPISFNVMEDVDPDKRFLVVNGLMATFEKIWEDAWSARMAYILQNTIGALLEWPNATILSVNRMYTDKVFRKQVVNNVTDPTVKAFWEQEFAGYTDRFAAEATPAIQNKIGQFASNALIRNIIGQPHSAFDMRKLMDEKKIFIVNLSKGRVGEGNANLLGSMLITKLYLAAMSRADAGGAAAHKLPAHYLYVDEFQSFANKSFADILSEARKYKLALTIAHQYIEQMEEEVRAAVFGNVGTMISFRVGSYDAEVLEKEFAPAFTMTDIVGLGKYQTYLKLMIDGVASAPFSATMLPPIEEPKVSYRDMAIAFSRRTYSRPRDEVEQEISEWHMPSDQVPGGKVGAPKKREKAPEVSPFEKIQKSKPKEAKPEGDLKSLLTTVVPAEKSAEKEAKTPEPQKTETSRGQDQEKKQEQQPPQQPKVPEQRRLEKQPEKPNEFRQVKKDDGKSATEGEKNDLKAALAALVGNPAPQESTREKQEHTNVTEFGESKNKRHKRGKNRPLEERKGGGERAPMSKLAKHEERAPEQQRPRQEANQTTTPSVEKNDRRQTPEVSSRPRAEQPPFASRSQSESASQSEQKAPEVSPSPRAEETQLVSSPKLQPQTAPSQFEPRKPEVSNPSHTEQTQSAPQPESTSRPEQTQVPHSAPLQHEQKEFTHEEIQQHVAQRRQEHSSREPISETMLRNILDVSNDNARS